MRAAARLLAAAVLVGCATRTSRSERLVDLATLDPTIRVQLPYAGPDNFTGTTLYPVSRCLLRPDVAARGIGVHPEGPRVDAAGDRRTRGSRPTFGAVTAPASLTP